MNSSILVLASFALLGVACSTTVINDPGAGDGGASTSPTGSSTSTTTPGADGSAPSAVPPASTVEADVEIGATCPAFTACGGSLDGTYDYSGGCLGDLLADARKQCPTLDSSGVKVVVKGSLHFSGGVLDRNVVSTVSGVLAFPAACAAGQCGVVETALKGAGFPTAKCTGSSACDCTVSRVETTKNKTTFTTAGSTVTTGDGETYEICAKGADVTYRGKSAGSEEGSWSLKKR